MRLPLVCVLPFLALAAFPGYAPAELNGTAMCDSLGFNQSGTNLVSFMRRLDLPSPSFNNGATTAGPVFWPLYSTHDLSPSAPGDGSVTTLAIFVHGLSAQANTYFCTGQHASLGRNALVIAPVSGISGQRCAVYLTSQHARTPTSASTSHPCTLPRSGWAMSR